MIRSAGLADISIIHDLAHTIWPYAYGDILSAAQLHYMLGLIYSPASLRHQMETQQHQFLLAYADAVPVGFASCSAKTADDPSIFRLHKIYVLPSQQGKGTGQLLLNQVCHTSVNAGAKILELNVNRHNKALHFYQKNGFRIIKEEDISIGQGYFMNDYVMQKIL